LLRALGREQREGSQHKTETIDLLLARYPELPFVLFGDSGESDPDIYLDLAHRHPGRVRTIYIRDESGRLRGERGRALHAEAERHDAELVVVTRTDEALEHARKTGLVVPTWPVEAAANVL
jgi:phosphatidate phosphatase APP1